MRYGVIAPEDKVPDNCQTLALPPPRTDRERGEKHHRSPDVIFVATIRGTMRLQCSVDRFKQL
jgi:hypothetical protein